jgi:Zn finger protein HypA/HybF involved in hydrogenase expression
MTDLNFCPNCNAAHFKIIRCDDKLCFCRECSKFFLFEALSLKCTKCESDKIVKSDFPSPKGEVVFQCSKCKKMWPASEFLKVNKGG